MAPSASEARIARFTPAMVSERRTSETSAEVRETRRKKGCRSAARPDATALRLVVAGRDSDQRDGGGGAVCAAGGGCGRGR